MFNHYELVSWVRTTAQSFYHKSNIKLLNIVISQSREPEIVEAMMRSNGSIALGKVSKAKVSRYEIAGVGIILTPNLPPNRVLFTLENKS